MRKLLFFMLLGIGAHASAHQFTPTYPKFEYSHVDNVLQTTMQLFNRRNEVEYYEINVFDENWGPMPFATEDRIVHVPFLTYKTIHVYIRQKDLAKALYICSHSKLTKQNGSATLVLTRICSKIAK